MSDTPLDVYTRMNSAGPLVRSYIRLRFGHDNVTRSHIVDGTVVEERDVTAEYVNESGQWTRNEHE